VQYNTVAPRNAIKRHNCHFSFFQEKVPHPTPTFSNCLPKHIFSFGSQIKVDLSFEGGREGGRGKVEDETAIKARPKWNFSNIKQLSFSSFIQFFSGLLSRL
jgi:hypothetical protein